MGKGSETKKMSLWGFLPLCLLSAAVGGFVFGTLGAVLSSSDGLIVIMMLLGMIAPVAILILRRRKRPSPANTGVERTIVPNASTASQTESAKPTSGPRQETMLATVMSRKIWALVVAGGVVYGVWVYFSSSNNLGLELIANRGGLLANGVSILNTRSTPIKILDISVNGRDDCYRYPQGRERELKQGDREGVFTQCEVVRVIVKTDRGTATFHFQ